MGLRKEEDTKRRGTTSWKVTGFSVIMLGMSPCNSDL
jgi:hypothetical protein